MNVELLKQLGNVKTFPRDTVICMERQEGHTAYLLLQGRVEVFLGTFVNTPKSVALLSPGVIFGEMSLLEDKPRSATIIVSTKEASVLELTKDNFIKILQCDPDIAFNLLQTMLKRMNSLMEEIQFKHNTFVRGVRMDAHYIQISNLSMDQFMLIMNRDSAHALTLLKFLSRILAQIDEMAI